VGQPVRSELKANVDYMQQQLGGNVDLIHRSFVCGETLGREGVLFCLDVSASGDQVAMLLRAATELTNPPYRRLQTAADPVELFALTIAQLAEVRFAEDLDMAIDDILSGQTAFFLEGSPRVLIADTRNPPRRGVEEPSTESETRGPRDGFTEDVMTNLALVRRRLRDPRLRAEPSVVGRRTKTDVVVLYLKDVAEPGLVAEVKKRLGRIDVDSVMGTGYIEELIQDNPYSPFGALNYTERPDKLVGNLLEGRVGIMVDNSPFVLVVPTLFWHWLQAPGDYYNSFMVATAFRILRVLALLTALLAPSLYTILASFHHEMVPTPLALSMAAGREGTPLPTLIEVLALAVMFEIMHEAGLRLPRTVGQTVSIVGALVIGEAAVMAGLVSPATVIVVNAAGLSAFAIPFYAGSLSIRLIRIPLLLLSGTLGVFGFVAGTSFIALHVASLRNFGQPFLSPVAPLIKGDLKDTLVRAPWWAMTWRPQLATTMTSRRQGPEVGKQAPPARGKR